VRAAENLAARCFDGIVTADSSTLRRLARIGRSKKLVFYNFPNLDFFAEARHPKKLFDVVYRGGLSERAGTFTLLEAMRKVKSRTRDPRLLLIGYFDNPEAKRDLKDRIRSMNLQSNVEILGRIDHESMAETLGCARIGVSPLHDVPKFMLNIPVKVFEYWACGLPVVSTNLPPILPFLRHAEAGLLCRTRDADGLAQSISWLLDHPGAATQMGNRGRQLVEQRFHNRGEVHKFIKFCGEIAGWREVAVEEDFGAYV